MCFILKKVYCIIIRKDSFFGTFPDTLANKSMILAYEWVSGHYKTVKEKVVGYDKIVKEWVPVTTIGLPATGGNLQMATSCLGASVMGSVTLVGIIK